MYIIFVKLETQAHCRSGPSSLQTKFGYLIQLRGGVINGQFEAR